MKPLSIVLIESSIELVPKSIWSHPAILNAARRRRRRPGDMLLDKSVHYHAMKGLMNFEKRGRPDIVHISLLNALGSPLNKRGLLRLYVHTVNELVIFIDPRTRIPRNYNRFTGLFEQLLKYGKVPPGASEPLLYVKEMNLRSLLTEIGSRCLILLSEEGVKASPDRVIEEACSTECAIGIGCFPHGSFSETTYSLAKAIYSIYPEILEAWIVVSRIIEACERLYGMYSEV
ncbi:MAG: 16S rRNA methyltransferase [Sulfolobales archaeon]|nr:16S rRNA methyltransferase [Sulfolobales archaeon]MCX8199573.1 16S rRNA methyltransferase [Sulfolobales archaeon]